MALWLLIVNLAAGWFMAGLIWTIQLVHYALFDLADPARWNAFHVRHVNGITPIVGPIMLIELVTSWWLIWQRPVGLATWVVWTSAILATAMWLSTALLQIPLHNQLRAGYTEAAYLGLLRTNWLRTVGWSLRALVITIGLWQVISALRLPAGNVIGDTI